MALLPNFPISGDDYTVGKITTVAGSKEFKTKDAYLQSYGAVQAGDHIYIAPAGKFLIIASVTGENAGTLTDPCPNDCAVTDADLRIIFKTASSRLQGRTAMLLEKLSKGCLASLAELTPTEGQIFRATNVEGQLEAVDNTADNVIETDNRKFMTDKDRQSIDNVVKRVDGLTTDNVPETPDHKFMTASEREKIANLDDNYLSKSGGTVNGGLTINNTAGTIYTAFPDMSESGSPTIRIGYAKDNGNNCDLAFVGSSFNIYLGKFGDIAKFNVDGTTRFANTITIQDKTYLQLDGNITGTRWDGGNLWQHIENRFNSCVIDTRQTGWSKANTGGGTLNGLPSGYFANGIMCESNGTISIGGAQLQIKVPNRGWCPMAWW
ncbi:hypothetical protein [uncultured Bartonella sp.]|uniref:hypothetical protein n=1 Tax=uncultured Bartonella sp. TaxID=104108 RepID=UPI0025D7D0E9|nr:hypothetical protein [uncultured Bartonella sp.]